MQVTHLLVLAAQLALSLVIVHLYATIVLLASFRQVYNLVAHHAKPELGVQVVLHLALIVYLVLSLSTLMQLQLLLALIVVMAPTQT